MGVLHGNRDRVEPPCPNLVKSRDPLAEPIATNIQGPALLTLKSFYLKAFSRKHGCDWLMLKHQPIESWSKRPHSEKASTETAPTGTAPTGTASQNYPGYRNGLTKTASTETASTETAPRDDGAKPKRPHLKFASIIHGLDNIRTKIVSFKEKVKKLDTALFKNSYLLLTQNQNRNGPISNLQAEAYIYGLDNTHATIVSFKGKVKKLDITLFKNSYHI